MMLQAIGRLVALLMALVALTLLMNPVAAHTDAGAGHGHLGASLGGIDESGNEIPIDRLVQHFAGTLVVTTDPSGDPVLQIQAPRGSDLVAFEIANATDGTTAEVVVHNATRIARLYWDDPDDAPAPGTAVPDVRVSFTRQVQLDQVIVVVWVLPDTIEEVGVRVEAPRDRSLSGAELVALDTSHAPPGRAVWQTSEVRMHTLEFSIHPPPAQTDPALAVPPSPVLPWLIVLGIALVSGGAWALSKRLEHRDGSQDT